jgi:hypothetical protein
MPTVRPKCSPRPAARFERFDNLKVAGKPIAVDGIEQQDIAVAPQTGIPIEELGLRRGEQSFSRCEPFGGYGDDMRVVVGATEPPTVPGIGFELKRSLRDTFEALLGDEASSRL